MIAYSAAGWLAAEFVAADCPRHQFFGGRILFAACARFFIEG